MLWRLPIRLVVLNRLAAALALLRFFLLLLAAGVRSGSFFFFSFLPFWAVEVQDGELLAARRGSRELTSRPSSCRP